MINQITEMLWYIVPLIALVSLIKTPWLKGVFGEFQVNLLIRFFLPKEQYHLIKNVTLPTEDGTTQIDHILVSNYGIFVIETKNMKGWIFGDSKQKQWTQKIFRHTSKFQNPLRELLGAKATELPKRPLNRDRSRIQDIIDNGSP